MKKKATAIGFLAALALSVGKNIGGAIWATPTIASFKGGPSAIIAMGVTVIPIFLAFPAYFTFIRLKPATPGHYYYPSRFLSKSKTELSQLISFSMMFSSFWIFALGGLPLMVYSGGQFLNLLFPAIPANILSVLMLTLAFGLVWFGLKIAGKMELILVAILLITLVTLVGFGTTSVELSNLTPIFPKGGQGFFLATAMSFMLAGGGLQIIDIGGEIREAMINLPKALLIGIGLVTILDIAVTFVVAGSTPYTMLSGKTLRFVAERILGGHVLTFVSVGGALIATFSSAVAYFVIWPKGYVEGLVKDKLYPEIFGKENRWGIPMVPMVLMYVISAIVVYFQLLPLDLLVSAYLFPTMGTYILVTIAGIRLPDKFPEIFEGRETRFSPKLVKWGSLASAILMTVFLIALSRGQIIGLAIFIVSLVAGGIFYYIRRKQIPKEKIVPEPFNLEEDSS